MPESDTPRLVARLLAVGTVASVALVAIGTVVMSLADRMPVTEPGPAFRPAGLPGDLLAGRASGFLWVGLAIAVALPSARVALACIGYLREGDRRQAAVALGVFAVLALSTAVALVTR